MSGPDDSRNAAMQHRLYRIAKWQAHYDVRPHACASIFHRSPCFENVYARVPVRATV
jgi:hypothetical protein